MGLKTVKKSRYYVIVETNKNKTSMYMTLPNDITEQNHKQIVKELDEMGYENAIITEMVKLRF